MALLSPKFRVVLSWSSGKDSAWALHLLRTKAEVDVIALLTTFNRVFHRVAMHAVRRELVRAQAQRAGLPLWAVELEWPCSNADYERLMASAWARAIQAGATHVAFGDLFLRDVREYRERQLQGTGLTPLFPLWELSTKELASEMVSAGVRAKVTCVDLKKLDRSFAGRDFDAKFLADLPAKVDPCGENGEFHTFVYDSPVFKSAIDVQTGEIVERDGFVFADVLRKRTDGAPDPGLCGTCANARVIVTDRGSEFYRCQLSDKDPRYPKYPRLPVVRCEGYAFATGEDLSV